MNITKPISLRNKLYALPRTLFVYLIVAPVALVFFLITLILAAIPKKYSEKMLFRFLYFIYVTIVRGLFLPVRMTGEENLPHEAAIFVANHESALDIPFLGMLMKGDPHFWYVFARFARMPFLGFLVRRIGVSIDQENAGADARALVIGIKQTANKKMHTLIFPEGGRFVDGQIHAFYSGFALIAKKTGRPVVPVLMHNIGNVYPPKSFFIYRFPVTLVIGPAFYYRDGEALKEFGDRVRDWFVEINKKMHD